MAQSLRIRLLMYVKHLGTCEKSQIFMKRMLKPGVRPELAWTRLVRGVSTEYGTRWYYAHWLITNQLDLKPDPKRRCQYCKDQAKQFKWMKDVACWHSYYKEPRLLAKDFPWSRVKGVLLQKLEKEGL